MSTATIADRAPAEAAPRLHGKTCFLTTVYPSPLEPRMFYREARTLAAAGCEVVFICQHTAAETIDGIRIVPLRKPRNRLDRMTRLMASAVRKAIAERADVYHIHSPELLVAGLLLRLIGKKVIYDAHEAFREKMHSKAWIPAPLRGVVSRVALALERIAVGWCDAVVTADSFVAGQFRPGTATVVANFPVLATVEAARRIRARTPRRSGRIVAYLGVLTKERGLYRMLEAVERCPDEVRLLLMGRFVTAEEEARVRACRRAVCLGMLPLDEALAEVMGADVGMALFEPVPGLYYAGENTNKLFEYMACGVPVIASRFPNLQRFVDTHACGLSVDPMSTDEVVAALGRVLDDTDFATRLGANGRRAVEEIYNWEREGEKLVGIYRRLLGDESQPKEY